MFGNNFTQPNHVFCKREGAGVSASNPVAQTLLLYANATGHRFNFEQEYVSIERFPVLGWNDDHFHATERTTDRVHVYHEGRTSSSQESQALPAQSTTAEHLKRRDESLTEPHKKRFHVTAVFVNGLTEAKVVEYMRPLVKIASRRLSDNFQIQELSVTVRLKY